MHLTNFLGGHCQEEGPVRPPCRDLIPHHAAVDGVRRQRQKCFSFGDRGALAVQTERMIVIIGEPAGVVVLWPVQTEALTRVGAQLGADEFAVKLLREGVLVVAVVRLFIVIDAATNNENVGVLGEAHSWTEKIGAVEPVLGRNFAAIVIV